MGVFRSLVLLTAGSPRFDPAEVSARMTEWTGLAFSGRGEEAENFITGSGNLFTAKLAGSNMFMITLLDRPYWESENVEAYAAQAEFAGARLPGEMRSARGAILIDSHLTQDGPAASLYLAKLAAASMDADARVLLVPPSWSVHRADANTRAALASAKETTELVPWLLNLRFTEGGRGWVWCLVLGMHFFDLPDLGMRSRPEEIEAAGQALQSFSMYLVSRGQAVPVGDTLTIPGCGDYRVAEPGFAPSPHAAFGSVELVPVNPAEAHGA